MYFVAFQFISLVYWTPRIRFIFFFFSSRRRHTRYWRDWSSDVCSSDLTPPSEERLYKEVHFEGVRPVIFEHTAWDLALATQALSYLKPELAFDISKVNTQQNAFQTLENSFLASAFTPASMSSDNVKGMATAM